MRRLPRELCHGSVLLRVFEAVSTSMQAPSRPKASDDDSKADVGSSIFTHETFDWGWFPKPNNHYS